MGSGLYKNLFATTLKQVVLNRNTTFLVKDKIHWRRTLLILLSRHSVLFTSSYTLNYCLSFRTASNIQFSFYFFLGSHQVLPSNNSILWLWRTIFSLRLFIKIDWALPSSEKVPVFLYRLCKCFFCDFFINSCTKFSKDWFARKFTVFDLRNRRSKKGIR